MAWTTPQKALVKQYQRFAGMSDQEYRSILYEVSGAHSSTEPHVTQHHFDVLMARLETRAHLAHVNNRTAGRRPPKLDNWYYWRRRNPERGRVNTRLLWKIDRLWDQLVPLLPAEHLQPTADNPRPYLYEMASQATGHFVRHLHDLHIGEALCLIEALKDRLAWALKGHNAA